MFIPCVLMLAIVASSCGGEKTTTQTEIKTEPKPKWPVAEYVDVDLESVPGKPVVLMKTSMGDIRIELDKKKAPITVKNFLSYMKGGHYNGTIFHRVMSGFMIQGGGYKADVYEKANPVEKLTKPAIKNEADNGLKNLDGTIAMARRPAKDSATAQFFINVKDNTGLDHRGESHFGYAVFGKVIEGMDVVDEIKNTPTEQASRRFQDLPKEPVEIISVALEE